MLNSKINIKKDIYDLPIMKRIYPISLLLAFAPAFAVEPLPEPESSALASGRWVKVRVETDGIYELTYERLRELGFRNPEEVGVYGYGPCVLLSHDFSKMPTDLTPVQTLHAENKVLFYGKANVEFAPELWETRTIGYVDTRNHQRHAHSRGATYFLSDARSANTAFSTIAAPEETSGARTTHTAVCFHEDDVTSLSEGGAWISGTPIGTQNPSVTHSVTLNNVAGENARMVYQSLMSPKSTNIYNFLLATYPPEFTAEEYVSSVAHGFAAQSANSDDHDYFRHSMRYQNITVPVIDAPRSYELSFSIHPQAAAQKRNCALDYFALLYERKNLLAGQNQVHMYFENWTGGQLFALQGAGNDLWQVWNVTDPSAISRFELTASGSDKVGQLPVASQSHPTEVIAFNPAAAQPEPEVLGSVDNQNLHAENTPDMLIITSSPLLEVANEVADVHRTLNKLDVLVVDQEAVFNEYGSGNVSPEAVRRFVRHLYNKTPSKLQALLMLGPGTIYNAERVKPGNNYVVTFQLEDYKWCNNSTRNLCNDSFFGHISTELASQTEMWKNRTTCLRILGTEQQVAVGRLPLSSAEDIRNYYAKVREYLTTPPTYPAWGNIVLSSDNATLSEQSHFADAEGMLAGVDGIDNTITVTRGALNYYIPKKTARTMQTRSLQDGAILFAYYGHGGNTAFGGGAIGDVLMSMNDSEGMRNVGRYPFSFMGSCGITAFDLHESGLFVNFLKNPNGGLIGLAAANRSVYQPMNRVLGNYFAKSLFTAENGEPIGRVWMRAYGNAVQENRAIQDIINHLDYNYVGDPMLPVYAPTHTVEISGINNDGQLTSMANNVVEGRVLNRDGVIDTDFAGSVVLTVYDVPQTLTNRNGQEEKNGHLASFTMDSRVIGRYAGTVKNGVFSVKFIGPVSSEEGMHRIQAYVYSSDANRRGYGAVKEVALNYNQQEIETPQGAMTEITSFYAGTGDVDVRHPSEVTINAVISAPKGLGQVSEVSTPVRLTIDGVAKTDATMLLSRQGNGIYTLKYVTNELAGGRHQATLTVLDASGEWAVASIEFNVDNAPAARLTAAIDGGEVNFDLSVSGDADEKVLYVENISGNTLLSRNNPTFPLTLNLEPGLYRAFVQIRGESSLTSTPKVDLFVE